MIEILSDNQGLLRDYGPKAQAFYERGWFDCLRAIVEALRKDDKS